MLNAHTKKRVKMVCTGFMAQSGFCNKHFALDGESNEGVLSMNAS